MNSKQHPADAALLDAVIAWRDRQAQPDLRGLPAVSVPALAKVRKVLPHSAGQRALAAAYATSVRLSQPKSVLKEAKVDSLAALRALPLASCNALARKVSRQSGWLAGGSGAALGIAGVAGLVADAPALLLIALRTLVRIGYCYGEEPSPALVAALFALASADTEDEKRTAWQAALSTSAGQATGGNTLTDAAVRDGLERAAEREFAKQALAGSLQKLGSTLVQRLGVKRAAGLLPVLGAVVGGAVNIRFVYLLSESARMVFIARRLLEQGVPRATLIPHLAQADVVSARAVTRKPAAAKAAVKKRGRAVPTQAKVATKKARATPRRQRPARVP